MEITVKGEKEGASSIKSDPNPFEGDRIGPSPLMANVEGADVTSESKNDGKNASEVGSGGHAKNGEVADKEEHEEMTEIAEKNVEMDGIGREVKDKCGGIKGVIGEEGHGVAAIDEGKIEMVGIEGEVKDEGLGELNSTEGKDDEQVVIGGGEEEQAVEFWVDDDEEDEEDEDGDEFEDEREGKMETEDKNVEEVNIAKTDEKMEINSKEMLKTLITSEDKPESSSKIEASPTLEDNSKTTSTKKKGDRVAGKKQESSSKGKAKKVESMGLIFMCNSKTKQDCYRYKILGLPATKKDLVAEIYKGMRLFLFDIDLRLMYGIYKAAAPGGYNIKPKAFGSAFPSQVRFTISEDCLPLAEEKFKPILKDNYYAKNKFDCKLNSEQVKKLCQLFNGSGIPRSNKKLKNVVGTQAHHGPDRARNQPPLVERERLSRGRKRKQRLEDERERDRIRRQILDEERLDRDRIRWIREDELRLDLDRIRRQRLDEEIWERERLYDRERYLSALPPPSRAYDAYGRIAETVVYVREPVMDRRIPILDYPDHRILDADLRHREVVRIRDPITSYSEVVPAYPPLASSASEYRPHGVAPLYEYAPPRSMYR